jgi:recombination DNA repair RAD52 pathway protein
MTTENQSPDSAQDFLKTFSEQLNLFMEQTVVLHNRVSELEIAIAYLLSKDPQWVENFKSAQAAEHEQAKQKVQESTLVEPE